MTGEKLDFSEFTCLGIHSFFINMTFLGVFLMKDASKISGIPQKKYGCGRFKYASLFSSLKICLNHA